MIQSSIEKRMPYIYTIDSIIKNVGGEYLSYFGHEIPLMFNSTMKHGTEDIRARLLHLLKTWEVDKRLFHPKVLDQIHRAGWVGRYKGSAPTRSYLATEKVCFVFYIVSSLLSSLSRALSLFHSLSLPLSLSLFPCDPLLLFPNTAKINTLTHTTALDFIFSFHF